MWAGRAWEASGVVASSVCIWAFDAGAEELRALILGWAMLIRHESWLMRVVMAALLVVRAPHFIALLSPLTFFRFLAEQLLSFPDLWKDVLAIILWISLQNLSLFGVGLIPMHGNRFFVIHVLVQVRLMEVELTKLNWMVLVAKELLALLSPVLQMMLLNRSLAVLYIDSWPEPPLIDVGPDRFISSSCSLLYAGSCTWRSWHLLWWVFLIQELSAVLQLTICMEVLITLRLLSKYVIRKPCQSLILLLRCAQAIFGILLQIFVHLCFWFWCLIKKILQLKDCWISVAMLPFFSSSITLKIYALEFILLNKGFILEVLNEIIAFFN